MHTRTLKIGLLLLLLGMSARVQAGEAEDRQQALKLYRQAMELFRKASYREAITNYGASHKLMPHRNNLYYMGESYRRLGKLRESHRYYTEHAKMLPLSGREAFAVKLEKLRWEESCAISIATHPGGASVQLGKQGRGETPADGAALKLSVPGGEHMVRVALPGHQPAERKLVAEFGEPQALSFVLKPQQAPAPAPGPAPPESTSASSVAPAAGGPEAGVAAGQEPEESAGSGASHGYYVGLLAGAAIYDLGDDALQVSAGADVDLRAGYLLRLGRLAVQAGVAASFANLDDRFRNEGSSNLITVLAGAGARVYLMESLWLGMHVGAGGAILLGANDDSAFFNGASGVEGTFTSFALRAELTGGWQAWKGLTLLLSPFCLGYQARNAEFTPSLGRVLTFLFRAGVAWEG